MVPFFMKLCFIKRNNNILKIPSYPVVQAKRIGAKRVNSMIMRTVITIFLVEAAFLVCGCGSSNPAQALERRLVAYYPFNGNADDESGRGNDGRVVGATPVENRFGDDSAAFHFDGTGDHIEVPHSEALNIEGSLSISVWIKPEGLAAWKCIVFRGDEISGEDPYYIRIYDSNTLDYGVQTMVDSGGTIINMFDFSMTQIVNNRWSHLAMIFENRQELSLYINGAPVHSRQTRLDNRGADRNMKLFIGSAAGGQHFSGDIDDVRIYSRALSANEVAALSEEKD
ncbi:MAG: hypothetical protein GF401_13445 [Chitinivibrionales bacterium]|nr:hypothetical protein [Chitinivibrionales bacterium]